MAGRKIRDEAEAVQHLEAQRASGLTLAEWARLRGIDGRSLNLWRLNLSRRAEVGPGQGARLVELVAAVRQPAPYTIRCGRLTVELGEDFDEETLLRLLQVVAAC